MAGLRISGLASGMDIDSIVSDMMKAKRIPLDKLHQKKQLLEWQRDDYRSMNTLLQNLDKTIFDNVFLQKSFIAKKVTSSNDSAVSAVAISSQSNVSNKIDVVKLATAASWKSAGDVVTSANFTVAADNSIKANADTSLKFKVMDPGSTDYREISLSIKKDDSIDTVLSKLNNSNLGISAMRVDIVGEGNRVIFTSNKTGAEGELVAADGITNTFLKDLGFSVSASVDTNTDTDPALDGFKLAKDTGHVGEDAEFKINDYQMKQTSNTFTINGIQYTLKTIGTSNISTTTDVDTVYNNIKTFVDKYNEVIEKINGELNEEKYRSYQPLSDKEKEAMSDKQVEMWEEKARSGLLRNDSILSRSLNTMRMDLYTRVGTDTDSINNDFDQLSEIGIKTSSNYREGGKLIINETELKEAIEKDPNAVYQLFSNDGTTYETKGLARRLQDTIENSMESLVEKAGNSMKTNNQFTIGKLLNSTNSQIDRFEERMIDLEDSLYRQFTAMEKAIQKANSQSSYLSQYFS